MKRYTSMPLAGAPLGLRFAFTVFCLFFLTVLLEPCARCQAPPRMNTITIIIIKGYKRERGRPTRLIKWPVEAIVQLDDKDYPVVQTLEHDPVIMLPRSPLPKILKVIIKGRPDAKLKHFNEEDADATGKGRVYFRESGFLVLDFDMPNAPDSVTHHLPIIFLPGVAGTILHNGGPVFELWPLAPTEDRANLALEPDGKTPARKSHITAGDILRRKPGMNFYGGFIESLKPLGYTEGQDLIPFPYDWRLSNDEHFAQLDEVIDKAINESFARTGQTKVILAAHSMGGVLARGYIYSSPERAAKVDSLITMGTPYLGATKVFYGVVNGYQFGNITVRQELMKILMQNYPAAYQLLPQKPFVYDASNGDRLMSLDEVNAIRYKWFSNVQLDLVQDTYTPTIDNEHSFNPGLLRQARQFMSGSIEADGTAKPLPAKVKQYVIIGTGVSTLTSFRLEDWTPEKSAEYLELGNRKVILHPVSGDGDGTVPLWSLETPTATKTYYVPYERGWITDDSSAHGDLPANKTVQAIVAQIIQDTPPDTSLYPRPQQWMGLPITPGKVLEKLVEFELHSDAHLRISHASGKALGFNKDGGIDESLLGTFLCMNGMEYASLGDPDLPVTASVVGIRDGKFTLNVKIKRADGTTTPFSYREVPVHKGTVAQIALTPGQVTAPPSLNVTTNGKTTTIAATLGTVSGVHHGPIVKGNPVQPPVPISGKASPGGSLLSLDLELQIELKNGKIVIASTANNPLVSILELQAGDRILFIEGKSTDGMSVEQARALMRGGTSKGDVTLKILRSKDGKQITISIPPEKSLTTSGSTGGQGSPQTTTGAVISAANRLQAEQFMDKGTEYTTDGQWAQAEAAYRQVVRLDPTRQRGWLMLGQACEEQNKWPEAATAYRELVKLSPNTGANHGDLAHVLLKQSKRAEAIREAKEAIRLGEIDHPVFEELGIKPE